MSDLASAVDAQHGAFFLNEKVEDATAFGRGRWHQHIRTALARAGIEVETDAGA